MQLFSSAREMTFDKRLMNNPNPSLIAHWGGVVILSTYTPPFREIPSDLVFPGVLPRQTTQTTTELLWLNSSRRLREIPCNTLILQCKADVHYFSQGSKVVKRTVQKKPFKISLWQPLVPIVMDTVETESYLTYHWSPNLKTSS